MSNPLATTALLIAGFVCTTANLSAAPLNVILIVADDLGAADLGCTGSTYHRTPELDKLAAEGLRWTQAYSACPVCSPSRAALMTGKWPARLHLTDWLPGRADRPDQRLLRPAIQSQLPVEEKTLAEYFREAGYATQHLGKWHLGGVGFGPLEHGFEGNIAGDHSGSPASYFAPFRKHGHVMPGLEKAPAGEYLTDRLTLEAEKFLDQQSERPFFLQLNHYAVHTPLSAPGELVEQFPQATPFAGQQNNPMYAAMLLAVDRGIGRLRAKLLERKLAERTLIIFTSDNGGLATSEGPLTPATSNAPFREGKGWLYEGGIRIPLIMAGAGVIRPGRTTETAIIGCDLLPTLVTLCGLTAPVACDGQDLANLVNDQPPPAPKPLYWHYPHYSNQRGRPCGAIREGDWKLIEFYETGRRELFHLGKDPRESRNLAIEEPAVVEKLGQQLAEWRQAVGAQVMTSNPAYRPNLQQDDGTILLQARHADVTGTMLRYEPMPHKDTLGYWVNPEDTAVWNFVIQRPGRFVAEALMGCGNGSEGSEVEFRFTGKTLPLKVTATGGFQKFVPQSLGQLHFPETGTYRLEVVPRSKPGPAVMDLRQVVLKPVP